MAVLQRRQPIALVVAGIVVIAHADQRAFQQIDDRRNHLLAGKTAQAKIVPDPLADQHLASPSAVERKVSSCRE